MRGNIGKRWARSAVITLLSCGAVASGGEGPIRVAGRTAQEMFSDPRVAALADAAATGRIDEVERLVTAGVAVDALGYEDATPLTFAMLANGPNSTQGMEALLKLGANPNHRKADARYVGGWPIVLFLSRAENPALLEVMLKYGANPDTREPVELASAREFPYEGDSLLIKSVMRPGNVRALLRHDVDVNLRPQERPSAMGGRTAADMAASLGQFEVVELLLAQGANAFNDIGHALQARRWSPDVEPRRVAILRQLHAKGGKIYASRLNPQTPAELISPGKWKYEQYTGDKPVKLPPELLER